MHTRKQGFVINDSLRCRPKIERDNLISEEGRQEIVELELGVVEYLCTRRQRAGKRTSCTLTKRFNFRKSVGGEQLRITN